MKPELSVIRLFLKYEHWNKYSHLIGVEDFPDELKLLYRTLDGHHHHNDEGTNLHLMDLANLFFANRPKDVEFYESLFDNLKSYEPNETTVYQLIKSIVRAKKLRELSIASYEVAEGKKDFNHVVELISYFDKLEQVQEEQEEDPFVSSELAGLLAGSISTPGLRWRLASLNNTLGSLRPGDFGFIFARPETGKTTFLASEMSFMAGQTDRPILWVNNEEQGSKVQIRVYQAALGVPLENLKANPGSSQERYIKATKDNIKIVDRVGVHYHEIEKLCEKYKPALVLFDQIDKIKGFKADREDLALGAIYIWARELAKRFSCPVIGVCQADGTGENVKWLTMSHVANAKTSKQAEADWILGIGCIHDTGWEMMRFFNISKNKLLGDDDSDPKLRHGRWEVRIDPYCARYEDLK